MNRAVTQVAKAHLSGQKTITEGMLNQIEVAVRAYDPCLPVPPMRWVRCRLMWRCTMPRVNCWIGV